MTSYLYFYCANSQEAEELPQQSEYRDMRKALSIKAHHIMVEVADAQQPLSERPLLKDLINRYMNRGDTLVLPGLNSLGNSAEDIQKNMLRCARKSIHIHCCYPHKKLISTADGYIFTVILTQIQHECRKMNLAALKTRNITKPLGRREGSKHYNDIQTVKFRGLT
ncbi:hypothetical protein BB987_07035 [Photorhabdus temperata]|uniref:Site-specific recombinase, DNA invertase Pin n=1 Tax=Photorhabdus khanii NC19 TaxID=1004151 RepID=W3VAJ4_9GAMM|nr:hypothetical protein [Photorhabdus khanii]ETS32961.1 site-specific recombinase, DNA invertase Pin [Photorhabdus khanii NC19]OHV55947.1 hypothetical protein BB987_07035 [Photorhabdus temperata]